MASRLVSVSKNIFGKAFSAVKLVVPLIALTSDAAIALGVAPELGDVTGKD